MLVILMRAEFTSNAPRAPPASPRTLPSYTSLPTLMRMPPMSAGFSLERRVERRRRRRASRPAWTSSRTSSASGTALSTTRRMPVAIEPHQPLECRQDRAARRGRPSRAMRCATCRDARLVERARRRGRGGTAAAPSRLTRLVRFIARPASTRQLPRGLLREPAVIVRRQDLAGHRRGRLHDEPADLALELGEHARALALGRLARARPGSARRPAIAFCVSSAWTRAAAARASSISCLPSAPAFASTSCRSAVDPGQLRLDLLGVGEAAGDLLPPRLEHREDRLVGEQVQHRADDAEADDLRAEVRPVDAERPGDLLRSGHRPPRRPAALAHA